MVNPIELRIGNYIEYNSMVMMIDGIQSPRPMKDKRYSDKYIISLFDGAGLITCTLEEISSVDLNEEIISKICFKEIKVMGVYKLHATDDYSISFSFDNDMIYIGDDIEIKISETSLHRLQNLHFDLTGKHFIHD